MIIVGELKDVRTSDSQFLVVPYNYILDRPFATGIDVVASKFRVLVKFLNILSETIMVNVDLISTKRIYKTLQQAQKERKYKYLEINIAYLIG